MRWVIVDGSASWLLSTVRAWAPSEGVGMHPAPHTNRRARSLIVRSRDFCYDLLSAWQALGRFYHGRDVYY